MIGFTREAGSPDWPEACGEIVRPKMTMRKVDAATEGIEAFRSDKGNWVAPVEETAQSSVQKDKRIVDLDDDGVGLNAAALLRLAFPNIMHARNAGWRVRVSKRCGFVCSSDWSEDPWRESHAFWSRDDAVCVPSCDARGRSVCRGDGGCSESAAEDGGGGGLQERPGVRGAAGRDSAFDWDGPDRADSECNTGDAVAVAGHAGRKNRRSGCVPL